MGLFSELVEGVAKVAKPGPALSDIVVTHQMDYSRIPAAFGAAEAGPIKLPSPSLGVHKTGNPNLDFGDVTLVVKPQVLDEPGVSTYRTDVFSRRRQPETMDKVLRDEDRVKLQQLNNATDDAWDSHMATGNSDPEATNAAYQAKYREMEEFRMEARTRARDVPSFFDEDLNEYVAATPESVLNFLNRVPDRLSEGAAFKEPDRISTILAAAGEEFSGTAGLKQGRKLLRDTPLSVEDRAQLGAKFDTIADGLGSRKNAGSLVIQAMKDPAQRLTGVPEFDDPIRELAETLHKTPTEYGEVRPHRVVTVGKGGDVEVAIVPKADPFWNEDEGFSVLVDKGKAALKSKGVEVIEIPFVRGTPEFTEAFKKVMDGLKDRGYVFGAGGAAVLGVASFARPEEAMAAPRLPDAPVGAFPSPKGISGWALKSAGRETQKTPTGGVDWLGLTRQTELREAVNQPVPEPESRDFDLLDAPTTFNFGGIPMARSPEFDAEAANVAKRLAIDPRHLMAVMSFESGGTFDADVKNAAGSGATGLIQFMPSTAKGLGTTTADLAKLTPTQQLAFVERYFRPYKGKLATLEDVYMAVLWPVAIGKPSDYVLFRKDNAKSRAYAQNAGLDFNKDGVVTKAEAAAKVRKHLK